MQQLELARVSASIHRSVLVFCRAFEGKEFLMRDLARYVSDNTKGYTAPDSAGRILRDLRQQGAVSYTVVNRRSSLYRIDGVSR